MGSRDFLTPLRWRGGNLIYHTPTTIDLYAEGQLESLDVQEVGRYLKEKTNLPFRSRGCLYEGLAEERRGAVAARLAGMRVRDPGSRVSVVPLQGEVDYEKRRIADARWRISGILYDGMEYQRLIADLMGADESGFESCSILFTNQLFGTWDPQDQRYHARTSVYGYPHLISVTGLIEAPAKPKEYYLRRRLGQPVELLKEEYRGQFLDHGDSRMTEVVKGYAMQALFFYLSGDPFCEDPDCRLFNSHWQKEVLHAQLDGRYEYCPRHEAVLKDLKEGKEKG